MQAERASKLEEEYRSGARLQRTQKTEDSKRCEVSEEESRKEYFIGGLPPKVKKSIVRTYFANFGAICELRLMRCRRTKRFRGFAFLAFSSVKDPQQLESYKHIIEDFPIEIKPAMSKNKTQEILEGERQRKIFVSNLSEETTEDGLENFFEAFGEIESVKIIRDKITKKSKEFAFVLFRNISEVEVLLKRSDVGLELDGRTIAICQAVPKEAALTGNKSAFDEASTSDSTNSKMEQLLMDENDELPEPASVPPSKSFKKPSKNTRLSAKETTVASATSKQKNKLSLNSINKPFDPQGFAGNDASCYSQNNGWPSEEFPHPHHVHTNYSGATLDSCSPNSQPQRWGYPQMKPTSHQRAYHAFDGEMNDARLGMRSSPYGHYHSSFTQYQPSQYYNERQPAYPSSGQMGPQQYHPAYQNYAQNSQYCYSTFTKARPSAAWSGFGGVPVTSAPNQRPPSKAAYSENVSRLMKVIEDNDNDDYEEYFDDGEEFSEFTTPTDDQFEDLDSSIISTSDCLITQNLLSKDQMHQRKLYEVFVNRSPQPQSLPQPKKILTSANSGSTNSSSDFTSDYMRLPNEKQ